MTNHSTGQIKRQAKQILSDGNWGSALVITIIAAAIYSIISLPTNIYHASSTITISIGALSSALGLLIIGNFSYGIMKWYFNLSKDSKPNISQIFYYFTSLDRFCKGLHAYIIIGLIKLGFFILFLIGGIVGVGIIFLLYMLVSNTHPPLSDPIVLFIAIALIILIVLFCAFSAWIVCLRYALVPYIMADDENKSVSQCIKESKALMKGNEWKFIKLSLSFILWYISLIFILPSLYVSPYLNTSLAILAKQIINKDNGENSNQYINNDLDI